MAARYSSPRAWMVRALIAGLCVAALSAIAALLSGDFGDTHARIVGTSLGFSFFCALGASGDALRAQGTGALTTAGAVATGLAGLAFALLVLAIWFDGSSSDALWQTWGVAAVTALWASHWALVLRLRRPGESSNVRRIAAVSIATATVIMLAGDLVIVELVDDVSDGVARALGVVLVIAVLTTALPPVMRRLGSAPPADGRLTPAELAREIDAAADRIESVETPADARQEAEALRRLARRART